MIAEIFPKTRHRCVRNLEVKHDSLPIDRCFLLLSISLLCIRFALFSFIHPSSSSLLASGQAMKMRKMSTIQKTAAVEPILTSAAFFKISGRVSVAVKWCWYVNYMRMRVFRLPQVSELQFCWSVAWYTWRLPHRASQCNVVIFERY